MVGFFLTKRVKSSAGIEMPDETTPPGIPPAPPGPSPPVPGPGPLPSAKPKLDLGPGVGIGVQQDMAAPERKLPPAKILLIAIVALAVVVAILSFFTRAKPQGAGSVDNVAAVEIPGQNAMLVALTVTLRNTGEKPLWIHTLQGRLKSATGEYSDDAASAVDFERYFQAFPALRDNSTRALMPETKLQPGESIRGTIVVSFPVKPEEFDKRQSISAVIQPYDQPVPVVLTK
jgi:hypothetical protein